jgi:hypothetical protein
LKITISIKKVNEANNEDSSATILKELNNLLANKVTSVNSTVNNENSRVNNEDSGVNNENSSTRILRELSNLFPCLLFGSGFLMFTVKLKVDFSGAQPLNAAVMNTISNDVSWVEVIWPG